MKKYKIGYTTGVFDMFHIGHLNVIRNAKNLCEHLIVGVSTDELVQEYKNKATIIPFEERIEIVSNIKQVDQVVAQISMDKLQTCKELQVEVVFVGDDWKGATKWIEFEKQFNSAGIEVCYLPYTQGTSSTKLRVIIDAAIDKNSDS